MKLFHRLWRDDNGQSMVEYGLILALIAIAVIVEEGGEGSKAAAPLFRRVAETFFDIEPPTPTPTSTLSSAVEITVTLTSTTE